MKKKKMKVDSMREPTNCYEFLVTFSFCKFSLCMPFVLHSLISRGDGPIVAQMCEVTVEGELASEESW